jgi:hypothetical protein
VRTRRERARDENNAIKYAIINNLGYFSDSILPVPFMHRISRKPQKINNFKTNKVYEISLLYYDHFWRQRRQMNWRNYSALEIEIAFFA